jgi:hypothetical protein
MTTSESTVEKTLPSGQSTAEEAAANKANDTAANGTVPQDGGNPMPHVIPEGENATPLEVLGCTATDKLLIIMVGVSLSKCGYA